VLLVDCAGTNSADVVKVPEDCAVIRRGPLEEVKKYQDGRTITQDCTACHQPLAMDEASPEILKTLGLAERITQIQRK